MTLFLLENNIIFCIQTYTFIYTFILFFMFLRFLKNNNTVLFTLFMLVISTTNTMTAQEICSRSLDGGRIELDTVGTVVAFQSAAIRDIELP